MAVPVDHVSRALQTPVAVPLSKSSLQSPPHHSEEGSPLFRKSTLMDALIKVCKIQTTITLKLVQMVTVV